VVGGTVALEAAREHLRAGSIVAVRGLGGFHLACDARNDAAVRALRERKGRGDKPFAVMVRDEAVAERVAELTEVERRLLASPERPIVIVRRREGCGLAAAVAPGNDTVALFLPTTPLHILLFENRLDA